MIYREFLVVRKALAWFAGLTAIVLIGVILSQMVTTIDYSTITNGSAWLAAIFASIFGVALGNGSREAARVLWVLPTPRWKLAIQVIVMDLVGTTLAFACVYFLALAFARLHFMAEVAGTVSVGNIFMALAMTYATYGWSALVGMFGRRAALSGMTALPILMIWMLLAQSPVSGLGAILRASIVANPFAVFNAGLSLSSWQKHHFTLDPITSSLQWLGTTWTTPVLFVTAVATCALAVLLWQRAQVISP